MNRHNLSFVVAAAGLALALSAPAGQAAAQSRAAGPSASDVVSATPGEQRAIDCVARAQDDIGRGRWSAARNNAEGAETALLNSQQVDPQDARLQKALEATTSARDSIKKGQGKAADGSLSTAVSDLAAAPAPGAMSGTSAAVNAPSQARCFGAGAP